MTQKQKAGYFGTAVGDQSQWLRAYTVVAEEQFQNTLCAARYCLQLQLQEIQGPQLASVGNCIYVNTPPPITHKIKDKTKINIKKEKRSAQGKRGISSKWVNMVIVHDLLE